MRDFILFLVCMRKVMGGILFMLFFGWVVFGDAPEYNADYAEISIYVDILKYVISIILLSLLAYRFKYILKSRISIFSRWASQILLLSFLWLSFLILDSVIPAVYWWNITELNRYLVYALIITFGIFCFRFAYDYYSLKWLAKLRKVDVSKHHLFKNVVIYLWSFLVLYFIFFIIKLVLTGNVW